MGHEQAAWIQWLRLEWANITTAIDLALAIDEADTALQLVAPLGWYFFMIDETVAGTDWLHAALACTGSSDARLHSLALASWAFLASTGADPANAAIVAERALDTLDSYDDPKTEAVVAGMYVMCQLFSGNIEAASAVLPLIEDAAHRSGDRWTIAMDRLVAAEVKTLRGELVEAERDMRRAADGFAAVGDRFSYTDLRDTRRRTGGDRAATTTGPSECWRRAWRWLRTSASPFEVSPPDRGWRTWRSFAATSPSQPLSTIKRSRRLPGRIPQWMHAITLLGLANIARRRGLPDEALRHIDEAIRLPDRRPRR